MERAEYSSILELGREHPTVARVVEGAPPGAAQVADCQWARGALPVPLEAAGALHRSAVPAAGVLLAQVPTRSRCLMTPLLNNLPAVNCVNWLPESQDTMRPAGRL